MSSSRERAPFGEAPSIYSNAPPRKSTPVSSILVKNAWSRARKQLEPPSPLKSMNTTDAHVMNTNNDATRARVYKAEAYESKIRIASQEQQIEALKAELEELKFFQTVENNGYNDAEEREKKIKDDAELIEALAQELETMERDLNTSQLRVGELENSIVEAMSTSFETNNAIDSWEKREVEMTKQMELMRGEADTSKKREAEIIQRLESLQKEVNAEKGNGAEMKNQLELQQKESELWGTQREVELVNQLGRAKKDAAQFKQDAEDGLPLMRELDRNLRSARTERDNIKSQLSALRAQMPQEQDETEHSAVVKELQVALKSIQNEHDGALVEVENLEKSNKELQSVLVNIQSQFEDKVLEAQELRHENEEMESALEELQDLHTTNISDLKQEHVIEIEQMKENNETSISNLEAMHSKELEMKASLLQSRESYWENTVSELRKELVAAQSKVETVDSENKALNESLEVYNRASNCIDDMDGPLDELMSTFQSENKQLRARLNESSAQVGELQSQKLAIDKERNELKQTFTSEKVHLEEERDGLLGKLEQGLEIYKRTTIELEEKKDKLEELQSRQDEVEENATNVEEKNSKLKHQKNDLLSRLQQGIEIHQQTTIDLEAKNKELEELRSQKEMDKNAMNVEKGDTETLKKDYASAVELSVTRGKRIQALEADAQTYQSQLAKAAQKIKKLEKKIQSLAGNERLQAEVLRTKMRISSLQKELTTQLAKASHSEQLENELNSAQKVNEELQSIVKSLEEALVDMETALEAVSNSNLSARKSPVSVADDDRRKRIEEDAL